MKKPITPIQNSNQGINVYFMTDIQACCFSHFKICKIHDNKNLWELQDSVVAINEAGEKLETELLFWDQKKELIYTDRFVKITTEDQIVQGYGLESDPRLSRRRIKNLSATIYINEEIVILILMTLINPLFPDSLSSLFRVRSKILSNPWVDLPGRKITYF